MKAVLSNEHVHPVPYVEYWKVVSATGEQNKHGKGVWSTGGTVGALVF